MMHLNEHPIFMLTVFFINIDLSWLLCIDPIGH